MYRGCLLPSSALSPLRCWHRTSQSGARRELTQEISSGSSNERPGAFDGPSCESEADAIQMLLSVPLVRLADVLADFVRVNPYISTARTLPVAKSRGSKSMTVYPKPIGSSAVHDRIGLRRLSVSARWSGRPSRASW